MLQTLEFRKSEKLPESFTSEQPGEPESKMPKKSHSNGSCTVDPQMWSKAPHKTDSEGLSKKIRKDPDLSLRHQSTGEHCGTVIS